jgi:hypothetical protein
MKVELNVQVERMEGATLCIKGRTKIIIDGDKETVPALVEYIKKFTNKPQWEYRVF